MADPDWPADRDLALEQLIEHYRSERKKLNTLRAPRMRMTEGSDADQEFRIESGLTYALDFIDVLLNRVKLLEQRVDELTETPAEEEPIVSSGGIEGPFVRNDGSEIPPGGWPV